MIVKHKLFVGNWGKFSAVFFFSKRNTVRVQVIAIMDEAFLRSQRIPVDRVDQSCQLYFIDYLSQTATVLRMKTGGVTDETPLTDEGYIMPEMWRRNRETKYYYIVVTLHSQPGGIRPIREGPKILPVGNRGPNGICFGSIRNPPLQIGASFSEVSTWIESAKPASIVYRAVPPEL